jgi:integrase
MPRRGQKPTLVENGDGTYSVRLRAPEGYRLADGTSSPKRPTFGPFKTAREAERVGWKEIEKFEAWDPDAPQMVEPPTISALVDEFLAQYPNERDSYTRKCLTWNLNRVRRDLGTIRVDRLDARRVATWRPSLSEGSAWHVHGALKQILNYAVVANYVADNVAARIENPRRKPGREKVETLTWEELDAVADELPAEWRAIPVFAAATGLRCEEWIALTRADLDLKAAIPTVVVDKRYSHGEAKAYTKTGDRRRLPLQEAAVDALDRHVWRLNTDLVFYALRANRKPKAKPWIDLNSFRKVWKDAFECAGLAYRTPYALRHTYASESLAAGIPPLTVAARMGTSLEMLSKTYGHLVRDTEAWEVERLNDRARIARAQARERATAEPDSTCFSLEAARKGRFAFRLSRIGRLVDVA